jgi:hypothetical protein
MIHLRLNNIRMNSFRTYGDDSEEFSTVRYIDRARDDPR